MQIDQFGQTTSLTAPAAIAAWDRMVLAFLAHGAQTPAHLAETLRHAPDFAMAHAVKGLFLLLLGRRELVAEARQACATALACADTATVRERAMIAALEAYLSGYPSRAVHALDESLIAAPGDPLAVKLSHAIRFVIGDATGMRTAMEAALPAYGQDHPAYGYMLGCYAFALEETGDYALAEAMGCRGLDHAPDDAWGLHAVAHVYDMTGKAAAGLRWLNGRETAWAGCNNFRFHVWWHKALMHVDLRDYDRALALYDHDIRAEKTDDYRDIANATSLLSRLELDGIDVGDRWEELADLSMARTQDGCLIFADLHYLLALIGDDRPAATKTLVRRIARDAQHGTTEIDRRFASPGLAAAKGLEAFGDGDYARAFLDLLIARRTLQDAGGSHAQRDVFERLTIDAGIRAGLMDQAEALLDQRMALRGGHSDGYAAARRALISDTRRIPAE